MGPWPPALSNTRHLTCRIGKTSCHPPVSEDSHRRWSCKGHHILGHYSPGKQTWVWACLWRYPGRQAPGMPPSQRWPCTVILMFQEPRRHPMEPAAHKRSFDLKGPPLQVSGTLNGCSQVVVHIVFHISDAYYAPGGVRHKSGRMVHPTLTIHQALQWPKVLHPFHSRRSDQQPVVVGAGMEIAPPPKHLVGHNGVHRSIQLVTMGLPEMYCLQMPQAGSHFVRRWRNTEIISAYRHRNDQDIRGGGGGATMWLAAIFFPTRNTHPRTYTSMNHQNNS